MEIVKQFEHEPEDFYVYIHVRATDGKPFYVGKGCGKRYKGHFDRNPMWKRTAKKYGVKVVIYRDKLQEWAAFEVEQELIALYGRRNTGHGYLCNLTDGGEGQSGYIPSDESNMKRSAKLKGRVFSESHKQKIAESNKARILSDETKKKISDSRVGRFCGENHPLFGKKKSRESIEKTASANRLMVQCIDTEDIFSSISEASRWANVSTSQISRVCKGKQKACNGTRWRYLSQDSLTHGNSGTLSSASGGLNGTANSAATNDTSSMNSENAA